MNEAPNQNLESSPKSDLSLEELIRDMKAILAYDPTLIKYLENKKEIMEALKQAGIISSDAIQGPKLSEDVIREISRKIRALELKEYHDAEDGRTLTNMPKEVLNHIFKMTDFNTVQVLRKVSKPIRKFIDETSTEINLTYLALGASVSTRNMYMRDPNFKRGVTFRRHRNPETKSLGLFIEVYKNLMDMDMEKEITIENLDFADIARINLREILSHQKTVIPHVEFNIQNELYMWGSYHYSDFMKTFKEDILKGCKGKLKVALVDFVVMQEEQVTDLLEVIDPETIRIMKFRGYHQGIEGRWMAMGNIVKTPHWKNVLELDSDFPTLNPMEDYGNLQVAKFGRKVISYKCVETLRDAYLQSSSFISCEITFGGFRDIERFLARFGSPAVAGGQNEDMLKSWRFALAGQTDDIQISIHMSRKIKFHRLPREAIEDVIFIEREKLTPM